MQDSQQTPWWRTLASEGKSSRINGITQEITSVYVTRTPRTQTKSIMSGCLILEAASTFERGSERFSVPAARDVQLGLLFFASLSLDSPFSCLMKHLSFLSPPLPLRAVFFNQISTFCSVSLPDDRAACIPEWTHPRASGYSETLFQTDVLYGCKWFPSMSDTCGVLIFYFYFYWGGLFVYWVALWEK